MATTGASGHMGNGPGRCDFERRLRWAVAGAAMLGWLLFSRESAAAPRSDYDLDDDSLIEINDLGDLNDIRNAPFGTSLYGSDAGCPVSGCHGFELTVDLDFDTNGNGEVGIGDDYYTDDGSFQGWIPIEQLVTTFEGNNHVIRNLTNIGQLSAVPDGTRPQGLFSDLVAADVRNVRFEDPYFFDVAFHTGVVAGQARVGSILQNVSVFGGSMYTNGNGRMGGLVGLCEGASVAESRTSLDVQASESVGGLIGWADNCSISRSFVLGRTTSSRYHGSIGGLVGYMLFGSITDSFMSGSAGRGYWFGGLIGQTEGPPSVMRSYVSGAVIGNAAGGGAMAGVGDATFQSSFFATDTTGFTRAGGSGAVGVTLAQLKCSDAPNDPDCLAGLFAGWQTSTNSDGAPAWDFGTNQQVPALRIEGVVYRDSDGDGLLDADDEFPNNWEASLDSDNDGAIDFWREGCEASCRAASSLVLDQFPTSAAATLDLDLDGRPESFNPGCNAACQAASGLTLDSSANDLDNDGLTDANDLDDDGDGLTDVDLDSDNLIDISTIAELRLYGENDPSGASARSTDFIPEEGDIDDASGCRPRIVRGTLRRECDGYELLVDLDFDTNADGVMDELDEFWNDGVGWVAIGRHGDVPLMAFQTNFEGNGRTVYNLYTDGFGDSGLFGGVRGANIRNLGLTGPLMSVRADGRIGGLAGHVVTSSITNCYATGPITLVNSGITAGGLMGTADGTFINGAFATGDVHAIDCTHCDVGGLVGFVDFDATISATFASGAVSNDFGSVGGLVGSSNREAVISGSYSIGPVENAPGVVAGGFLGESDLNAVASYWATDTSGQLTSAGNAQGATVDQLECPVGADNTTCLPGVTLFAGWDDYLNDENRALWDFGTSSELPGLCLSGSLYRVNAAGVLGPVTSCECEETETELVTNQGFETNTAGWTGSYGTTISSSTVQKRSGARSLRIANRNIGTWQGASYNVLGSAVPGDVLAANLWARVEGDPSEPVYFTMRSVCQGASAVYTRIAEATATNTGWVNLVGSVVVPNCNLSELTVYAEGPRTTVVLYIDDVSVVRQRLVCDGDSGPLNGSFVVTNDWGSGYCVDLRVTNPNTVATTDWSATFNLNGTTITGIWNLDTTGFTGSVTVSPQEPWSQVIAPGGTSHSLGFCANRPSGSSALPSTPVATGIF